MTKIWFIFASSFIFNFFVVFRKNLRLRINLQQSVAYNCIKLYLSILNNETAQRYLQATGIDLWPNVPPTLNCSLCFLDKIANLFGAIFLLLTPFIHIYYKLIYLAKVVFCGIELVTFTDQIITCNLKH